MRLNTKILSVTFTLFFSTLLVSQDYYSFHTNVPDDEIFNKGLFLVKGIEIYNPEHNLYDINKDVADKLMSFSLKLLPIDTCLHFRAEASIPPRTYARVYAFAMKPNTQTKIKLQGSNLANINYGPGLCMICKKGDGSVILMPVKGYRENGELFSINVFENHIGSPEAYSANFNANIPH